MSRALRAGAAAVVLMAGCRTLEPPAVPLPPDDPRPEALLATLEAHAASLEALRAMAKLAVDGPGGSIRSRQVLVAARPARLRVEILGFLSQTVALLTTNGDTYDLFQVRERTFERDRVRPGLLWEVAGIDLEPAEAVRVLLGAPDTAGLDAANAVLLGDGGIGVLLVDAERRARRGLEFDAEGGLRRLSAWSEAGVFEWDVRYGDRQDVGGTPFAHAIEIDFPATGIEARLGLSRVDLNPLLPLGLFHLNPPPGTSPEEEPAGERG